MRHSKTTIKSPCCLALIVFVELSLFLKNNRFSLNLLARMVVIQRNMPNLQTISLLTCFCTSFVSFFFTLCYELPIFPLLHVHTSLLFNRTILEIIYIIIKEQSILLQRTRFFMILSNIREDLFLNRFEIVFLIPTFDNSSNSLFFLFTNVYCASTINPRRCSGRFLQRSDGSKGIPL